MSIFESYGDNVKYAGCSTTSSSNIVTNTNIPFTDILEYKSDSFEMVGSTALRCLEDGMYKLSYKVILNIIFGNSRSQCKVALYINDIEVANSFDLGYHRTAGQGADTYTSDNIIVSLATNDLITIKGTQQSGASTIQSIFAKLIVEQLSNVKISFPIITNSPLNTTINEFEAFSFQCQASLNVSWSLINAPAGMSISNTGLITYTGSLGLYNNIEIVASNIAGSDNVTFNLEVVSLQIPTESLVAWLDPSTGVTLKGNKLTSWADVANAFTASQTTNQRQPQYDDSSYLAPIIIGQGDDFLTFPEITLADEFTIYIVANSIGNRISTLISGESSIYHNANNESVISIAGIELINNNSWVGVNPVVIAIVRDLSNNVSLYINGAETLLGVLSGSFIFDTLLGSSNNINTSHDGGFGDLIAYNIKHSNTIINNVTTILRNKYGV